MTVATPHQTSPVPHTQGRFISFEGTEGVGKTTAIERLCARLDALGIEYVRTREPGGSTFAETLRAILLDPQTDITDDTELLLLFAARCDHIAQVILPALARGAWVICDRFVDSTIAYQGYGRAHNDPEVQAKITQLTAQFVPRQPDVTFWLDLPIEEGMRRAGKRGAADRFEQEAMDFFARVREGFEACHAAAPERIVRIDAAGDADTVSQRIWQQLGMS
ncbi:dTMP kinase [Psychrobacter aestuarii]|uniref:Thymidylate kinase n=1 Tax=Psychrobacter aestuarii TaxID=556327 RepID=A0ABP3FPU6_9GAMM|nr:dTMP kinase [Psychrobacter aestuarii]